MWLLQTVLRFEETAAVSAPRLLITASFKSNLTEVVAQSGANVSLLVRCHFVS